jgi:hypothetical protein
LKDLYDSIHNKFRVFFEEDKKKSPEASSNPGQKKISMPKNPTRVSPTERQFPFPDGYGRSDLDPLGDRFRSGGGIIIEFKSFDLNFNIE